ncbi:MAG: hypothetical protein H7319_03875 [Spirosoma sp.]|nr:hypothetical protein [Spirosoma sp.]
MEGINYLVNDAGERTAVVIDWKAYGEELEDFLDGLEAESRRNEPKEDFQTVADRLLTGKATDE